MNWKGLLVFVLIAGAALCLIKAVVPADVVADAGDGDQVFSHSVLEDCIDETELEDTIAGDSLSITAGIFKFYGDTLFVSSAICGLDTIADTGDSAQIEIIGITDNPAEWIVTLTPIGNWVSSLNAQTYWADTLSVHSSIAETGTSMKFTWKFERITN